MNRWKIFLFAGLLFSSLTFPVFSRGVPAFVSVEWLEQNLGDIRVVVIDIRNPEQFGKGHIPGALNAPFADWTIENNNLSLELPREKVLLDLLGNLGLTVESVPVIVNRTETDFSRADSARVAWTCMVAGVKNPAVLDGGYAKWLKAGKPASTEIRVPKPTVFDGRWNGSIIAVKSHVLSRIGKSMLVDARVPDDYFGIGSSPGHIKSAVNLPAPWAYAADGTIRKEKDLQAMAQGVIGSNKDREIITYCEVGGYASTWWFLLTQVLGYRNVKLYDGSIQEWIRDTDAPVTAFRWH
jgi:thiosulfate/3-mercaptopyruvate sulfurtransferase